MLCCAIARVKSCARIARRTALTFPRKKKPAQAASAADDGVIEPRFQSSSNSPNHFQTGENLNPFHPRPRRSLVCSDKNLCKAQTDTSLAPCRYFITNRRSQGPQRKKTPCAMKSGERPHLPARGTVSRVIVTRPNSSRVPLRVLEGVVRYDDARLLLQAFAVPAEEATTERGI